MFDVSALLNSPDAQIAVCVGGVALLALLLAAVAWVRVRRLQRRLRAFLPTGAAGDVLEALAAFSARLDTLARAVEDLAAEERELKADLARRVRTPSVIRFNAFPGMGSDLSYAVALLDDERNGVVLSAIQGREETRVYAKPVQHGQSTYLLTPEEERAIQAAGGRDLATK
ncbi:MAG: DUF4446 family protein [Clostridia bacterium]|nr:DUF4446 family protein [Clostridia bacterium]